MNLGCLDKLVKHLMSKRERKKERVLVLKTLVRVRKYFLPVYSRERGACRQVGTLNITLSLFVDAMHGLMYDDELYEVWVCRVVPIPMRNIINKQAVRKKRCVWKETLLMSEVNKVKIIGTRCL